MSLINCKINFILTWSENCVIFEGDRATTFVITYTECYVPAAILSANGNAKLLQQVETRF